MISVVTGVPSADLGDVSEEKGSRKPANGHHHAPLQQTVCGHRTNRNGLLVRDERTRKRTFRMTKSTPNMSSRVNALSLCLRIRKLLLLLLQVVLSKAVQNSQTASIAPQFSYKLRRSVSISSHLSESQPSFESMSAAESVYTPVHAAHSDDLPHLTANDGKRLKRAVKGFRPHFRRVANDFDGLSFQHHQVYTRLQTQLFPHIDF